MKGKNSTRTYMFAFPAFLVFVFLLRNGNIVSSKVVALEKKPVPSNSMDESSLYLPAIFSPPVPANWEQVDFAREDVTDIQISTSPKRIFASVYNLGLFESQDNGGNWQKHNVHTRINDIELHQTFTNTMYLATWSSFGVYQTQDNGIVWEPITGWKTLHPSLYSIATHPVSATVMFAGSGNWEFSGGEIYKTIDAGGSWYPVSPPYTNALTFIFSPSNTSTMLAGTKLAGIMKSVDGGESWVPANNGLSVSVNGARDISSLVFHPNNYRWIYAASSMGIFVSYDLAENWKPLWTDITVYTLLIDPRNKGDIYVSTHEGIFLSYDDGLTWSQLGQCGINKVINQLAIDPTDSDVIWVGTDDGIWTCSLK